MTNENKEVDSNNTEQNKATMKTYRDFALNALKDKPTSLAKMIIKEKKKQEVEFEYSPKNKKNVVIMVLSGLLLLAAIVIAVSIFVFSSDTDQEVSGKKAIDPKSIVYFDYKIENDITGGKRKDIKRISTSAIENTNIPINDVKLFYFINKINGEKQLVAASDFLNILDTRIPARLVKNIGNEFSLGVVSTIDGNMPFLVFNIDDFDISYNSILV
jgi:hypothetical protein